MLHLILNPSKLLNGRHLQQMPSTCIAACRHCCCQLAVTTLKPLKCNLQSLLAATKRNRLKTFIVLKLQYKASLSHFPIPLKLFFFFVKVASI